VKLAKRRVRIYETPIGYDGRTYEEGKKIGLRDAFAAFAVILRYGLTNDIYKEHGSAILDAFSEAGRFNLWMADTVRPFVGRRVLEIGAGIGNLTRQLARKRELYIATDIDAEHISRLRTQLHHRPNLHVQCCDLSRAEDFVTLQSSVDTVVCLNVLEHVDDDLGALRNIHGALASGGRAIILVPFGPELFGSLDAVLGHYRRYSREEFRGKLEAAGFRIERMLDFNRISRPGWYMQGKVFRRSTVGRMQLRAFDALVWLWRRIDSHVPWEPVSIIAICTKG
jgi:SAM-dependent methyltransferase